MCRKFSFFVSLILVLCLFGNAWGLVWYEKDIGNPAIPGSASEAAGTWTISGSGHDIWGTADGFFYVYRPMSGDGSLQFNLISAGDTNPWGWSKVGPMIREDLGAGSKHAMTAMTGHNGVQFVWRENTNEQSFGVVRSGATFVPPGVLRITRTGDEMLSEFGKVVPFPPFFQWYQIGDEPATITMNTDVTVGMVVCASNNEALNTAVLNDVILTAAPFEKPWDLSPADGSTRMPLTTTLSWKPGDSATSHDVYFGTDPAALPLATTKALGDESYAPMLELGTTYYWKIVEQPLAVESPIMSFSTERDIGAGTIVRQVWEGIGGTAVADLTRSPDYPLNPTWVDELTILNMPQTSPNLDNYGMRFIGYLAPELSGSYTFWIASDDASQLWLSLSGKACDAQMLCEEPACCHGYDGTPQQKSDPVSLVGGEMYPIWVLLKEGGGGDWLGVAWEGPDAPSRTEIDGYFLVPGYIPLEAIVKSPADGATLTVGEATEVSFQPGETAVSHNVYLGTDPAALSLVATVAMPDTTAALPAVSEETTYYLRIDADDGTDIHEGCVSSFSTVEWANTDISSWGGSATKTDDCWTIVANGHDIWGGGDGFHFVYKTPTLPHDQGTITAHVTSLTGPDWWTKAGIMMRETLDPGSINTAMLTTRSEGANLATFQWRDGTGWGTSGNYQGGIGGAPEWLRLERNGNGFRAYYSEDGVNWTMRGEHTTNMSSFIRIGMAVTSHNTGALATAEICDFTITTPDPRAAWRRWDTEPTDGATGVDIHAVLHWFAGDGATQHMVYISEDEEAVINRTVDPVTLPAETTELYVGPLDLTKTYYWCVDEVVNPIIPGEVYSFTVEDYRVIDDFEVYDIEEEAPPEQEVVVEGYTVTAEEPPEQTVIDPGYTIPGYTIEAVAPDAGCLLAEWAFEGNYDDTSGNGFHGTAVGDATIVTDAERGDVLSLDSDGDYVDCGNPAALNFGTGNWSLSAWVKNTMTGTGDDNKGAIIANGGDGGGGHRYCLILSEEQEGEVTLVIDDNADDGIGSSYNKKQARGDNTKVNNDVWHHVLGVRDGDTIKIYINGVLEGSTNIGGADYDLSGTDQNNVLIGAITRHADGAIYKDYGGLLDDVQIYDCNLTEGNARYLAGLGDLVVPPIVIPPTYGPLMVHYEFEDNANDSSGNSRDGTETAGRDGDMPSYEAGMVGQAIRFYDKGDHVVDDDCELYMDGLDALTISCWIKSEKTDIDEGWVHFSTNWNDQRSFRYDRQGASSNRLRKVMKYGVAATEGSEEDESSYNVQTTEWQHVAMTWQSGVGIKLYIDGILDQPGWDAAARGGVTQGYSVMFVGKGSKDNSTNESWNGLVDDLRIYSTVLSYGQVRYLAGEMDDLVVPPVYGPMIAGYDFEDGTATDMSGNNFHGTLMGDASISDGALNLDGNGDYVDLGRDNMFNLGQGPFSISTWVNLSGWGGNWGNVIVSKRGENGRGWQLRRRGSATRLTWTTRGPGDDDPQGAITPSLNEWHHVVCVYDGSSKTVYLDGELDAHRDGVNNLTMAGHNTYIGGRANRENTGLDGGGNYFNGKVGDLRMYRHYLTFPERLYLSGYRAEVLIGDTWSGRAAALPELEYETSNEGEKCMRVEYTGSGAVSCLVPWDDGKHPHGHNSDFSLGKAQALSMWVKGDPENAPGTLFAQLTTVVPSGHTQRVMYDGDITSGDWEEWNISLLSLSTGKPADPIEEMGLPITKIKDVGVGVIGAGSGAVYIDDIRLQPVRCIPEFAPSADLDDDCDVDRDDTLLLVRDFWLAHPGVPGVLYEYYEGSYNSLDEFYADPIAPKKTGVVDNFDISVRDRGDQFAFRFRAQIEVPTDGVYTFYTSSDDGSELYINGKLVVDNDGLHGMQWREGDVYLTAGLHNIMVTMFEQGGGEGLLTEVAGPGIPRIPIPNEVLFMPYDPAADLNSDGMVNFLDYANVLNSFIDAVLWPPMDEWLE